MLRIDSMQIVVTLGAVAIIAMPHSAMAQGESGNVCVRDYRSGAVCTANDVRIEDLIVVPIPTPTATARQTSQARTTRPRS